MIWTKLTRTNDVFSRAVCMVLLCAGKWIFGCLRKFQEKSQKIHAPEGPLCQKWDQWAAKGAPGSPLARLEVGSCPLAPWGPPPSSGSLSKPLFIPVTEKSRNRSRFSNQRRG